MIHDGIMDYLLPKDIFKICMLSHEYYDVIYPRLLAMKDNDIRGIEFNDTIIYAYSNGYIANSYTINPNRNTYANPYSNSSNGEDRDIPIYIDFNCITTDKGEICHVSELLPYPIEINDIKLELINGTMLRFDIDYRDPMRDYYSAILGGLNYGMQLALRGLWTDSSRHLIKDYYVNDVIRDIEYDVVSYYSRDRHIESNIEHITKHVDAIYDDELSREYEVETMLTIDGEYVYDKKLTSTPYGIFNTRDRCLDSYSGSSIYPIHVYDSCNGPLHLFDYRGDIPGIPGVYLGNGRWEMGDPEQTFKYHISYDDKNRTILEAILHK